MSRLVYEKPKDLHVSDADKLTVGAFSVQTAKCVENDAAIFPKRRNTPGLWENRWFGGVDTAGAGYSKGEAVWVNTEDPDEFVIAYEHVIRGYAETNPVSEAELERIQKTSDRGELLEFYKTLVRGGWSGLQPLFYLGDLRKPAQIRISLVDDNRSPPSDTFLKTDQNPDGVWRNFFDASTEDELSAKILSCFREQESARMLKHVEDYHCSELSAPSEFLDGRLQSDFGNLVTDHVFRSHYWYQPTLPDGFDYVVRQGSASFQTGVRWFRQWNSGMLEHGGTVNVDETDRFCSTSGGITSVRLDWAYSTGFIAPQYAFPTDALNALFLGERLVQPGGTPSTAESAPAELQQSRMGAKYRFSIQLTPWGGVGEPYSEPSSPRFQAYCPKDVCYMANDMFMFLSNGQSKTYSYHIRGFSRS